MMMRLVLGCAFALAAGLGLAGCAGGEGARRSTPPVERATRPARPAEMRPRPRARKPPLRPVAARSVAARRVAARRVTIPPDLFTRKPAGPPKSGLKTVNALGEAKLKKHTAGANAFAWALYDRLRRKKGNVFFSPFSVSSALAMVRAGAAGRTLRQMAKVMRIKLPEGAVHRGFNQHLVTVNDADGGSSTVRVANSLWGQQGVTFGAKFLKRTRRYYDARLSVVDFHGNPSGAAHAINLWCAKQTNNLIRRVVNRHSFSVDTRLVLVNAIYFQSDWKSTFDKSDTASKPFYLDHRRRRHVKVDTMYQLMKIGYYKKGRLRVGVIPYLDKSYSMVVLTYRGRLSRLETRLRTRGALDKLVKKATPRMIEVYLPKFELTLSYGLVKPLSKMGMRDLFTKRANLKPTAPGRNLFVSEVRHRAYVKVDEEGTVAAAVTAVSEDENGDDSHPVLRADMPFLFFIRHNPTGLILFAGRVANPTPQAKAIRRRPRRGVRPRPRPRHHVDEDS